MKALEDAIYAKLAGDATLVALLATATSVFPVNAPEGSAFPYITYAFRDPHEDRYVFAGRAYEDFRYLVKGVTNTPDDDTGALAIAARIDVLLTDGLSVVTGYTVMYCRRGSRVHYKENGDTGDSYWHSGGIYRIMVDPN